MLDDYIPAYVSDHVGILHSRTAKCALEGIIHDSNADPHKLPRHNLSAYSSDKHDAALSARSIVDSIDWHSLPQDHPLTPEHDGAGWTPKEWDLINTYARIRGSAAHSIHAADSLDDATHSLRRQISEIDEVDDPETMYSVVYDWDGSRDRMTPPDAVETIGDTYSQKLYEIAKDGARWIEDNWDEAERHHSLDVIRNEAVVIVEIDGLLYCARPDQIVYTDDSPSLPDGLYTLDAKSTERVQPKHVLQAEAQRRAVDARTADDKDVHSILLRLGVETGEWDIHSSTDDDWPAEQAWTMFQRRAETLYNDGLVQAELSKL